MTFNPARADLRPCLQPAMMARLGVGHNEPAEASALKVVLNRDGVKR